MAYDQLTLAIIAIAAGTILGAVNSIFGYVRDTTEGFNGRKFALTVITGIGAAIVLVFANLSGIVNAQTAYEVFTQLGVLAFAIFGVNWSRGLVSDLVSNKTVENTAK